MLFQDFYKGRAFDAYTYFGAHIEGTGVWFRVYAPAAKAVYVIGDFSGWNRIRMDHGYDGGVFTAYVEGAFLIMAVSCSARPFISSLPYS